MRTSEQYIRAHVIPGARRERVSEQKGVYTIQVKEKAERGQATRQAREVLAEALNVSQSSLRLVKGATSRHKTFLLTNRTQV